MPENSIAPEDKGIKDDVNAREDNAHSAPKLNYAKCLRHYKKRWIQEEILLTATNREVAMRIDFGNGNSGMGKRPNILMYPRDIFQYVKDKTTSFHISEERWSNPLHLSTQMRKKELDDLRIGWDLIIDVDFPDWEGCKIITDALVKVIREHGVKSLSVKFSGNKGFHIGIPFESFPKSINGVNIENLFPDGAIKIAEYLIEKISYISEKIEALSYDDVLLVCMNCGNRVITRKRMEYVCSSCGYVEEANENDEYKKCPKCGSLMELKIYDEKRCNKCGSHNIAKKVNFHIDTILISSRHLYRSVYSLHEKSGLCSIPINPEKILDFDKNMAEPDSLPNEINEDFKRFRFLEWKGEVNEKLFVEAFDYANRKNSRDAIDYKNMPESREYEKTGRIGEEFFPPSIRNILKGLEDGRKRALFILINFLRSVGWSMEEVEKKVYEWNSKNPEPLKESYIRGQLEHQKKKEPILPPNYENQMYYHDLGILEKIETNHKNPVSFAKRMFLIEKNKKKKQKKKSNGDKS